MAHFGSRPIVSTPMTAAELDRRALVAGIVGTTASVMPAFLTAAVAVQLDADIGVDERTLGWCLGGFFTGAALGSALLGRVAERLGGVRAMRLGLVVTMTLGVAIAVAVRTPLVLGLLLTVAGSTNSLTQPAANLLLVERLPPHRMGISFALKQAGMPLATLIGGALVPTVALTIGWRWAFVVGAVIAAAGLVALPSDNVDRRQPVGQSAGGAGRRPDLPLDLLASYAVVGLLGAAAAGAMATFLVSAAEESGVAEGPAGLLLTAGSAVGIASRIIHGHLADGPGLLPIRRVAVMLAIGALGLMVFATDRPSTYALGLVPVFAAGWAWPGLFNLSLVRNNPSAPAAASGVSQTGVYIGAAGGPVVGGAIVTQAGYSAMWWSAAVALLAASALAAMLRRRLSRRKATESPRPS